MTEHDDNDASWPVLETMQSTLIGLTALIAALAPLALPIMIAILTLITFAERRHLALPSQSRTYSLILSSPALAAVFAFITFAALSTLWSVNFGYALKSYVQATVLGLASWYVAATISWQMGQLGQVRRNRFLRALTIPALIIGLYFIFEHINDNATTLFFVRRFPGLFDGFENTFIYDANQRLVGLDPSYFNRIAAALTLLTVAVVASLQVWSHRNLGIILGAIASVGMLAICLKSGSATALLALTSSAVVFAFSLWSPWLTTRFLQAALLIVTLTAIPLSMLPKSLGLELNTSLPASFRERIIIWNDIAHMALERPWFGFGVKSVKFTQRWEPSSDQPTAAEPTKLRAYAHPHNGYLQVWVELGLIGAVLFALAGIWLLNEILLAPPAMQKFALALAAGTMAMIGPAWDFWQPWLFAAIGFGWIALMMTKVEFQPNAPPKANDRPITS